MNTLAKCRICLRDIPAELAHVDSSTGLPMALCSTCWSVGAEFHSSFCAEQCLHRFADETEDERHWLAEEEEAARHLAAVDAIYLRWREAASGGIQLTTKGAR